jgi:hypothetical protein
LRHSIHDLHRGLWRFCLALMQILTHLRQSNFVEAWRLYDVTFTVIFCAQTGTPSYFLYEVTPVFRDFSQANSTIAPVDISKIYKFTIQCQIIIPREHTWRTATFGAEGGGGALSCLRFCVKRILYLCSPICSVSSGLRV